MRILSKISQFVFGISAAEKEARQLLEQYGREAALTQALVQQRFAADYGTSGEAVYWEEIIRILAETAS